MFLVTQLGPTLFNPMNCSPPGSSVLGDSPGKNTGVGCHALLQGIFQSHGSNPGLPHCRMILYCQKGFPGGSVVKNPPAKFRRHRRPGFDPWAGKMPWSRKQQLTPVFLPGKFQTQRSLGRYSSWGLNWGHRRGTYSSSQNQQRMSATPHMPGMSVASRGTSLFPWLRVLDSKGKKTPRQPINWKKMTSAFTP